MKCKHCNVVTSSSECNTCYRVKNGMPHDIFYAICARICSVYPVLRKRTRFKLPRPVGHPFCKNVKCVAKYPSYSEFMRRADTLKVRKKGPVISENAYWQIVSKPCIFCGISPCNGVDRYDSRLGYTKDNVVQCCFQCNVMKKNIDFNDFILKIVDICTTQGSKLRGERR